MREGRGREREREREREFTKCISTNGKCITKFTKSERKYINKNTSTVCTVLYL